MEKINRNTKIKKTKICKHNFKSMIFLHFCSAFDSFHFNLFHAQFRF